MEKFGNLKDKNDEMSDKISIPNSYRIAQLNFNNQAVKIRENQFNNKCSNENPYMKVQNVENKFKNRIFQCLRAQIQSNKQEIA